MAGSSFGTAFRITTWGETHGAGVGVVIDGCPAGMELCEEDIQKYRIEGNRDSLGIQLREKKEIRWKSFPESLKERQLGLRFLL